MSLQRIADNDLCLKMLIAALPLSPATTHAAILRKQITEVQHALRAILP